MWLEASAGTDSAGVSPIKAASAHVSARRGLQGILFIILILLSPIGLIGPISPISPISPSLNKFQLFEPNPFIRQQRERKLRRLCGKNLRPRGFARLRGDRGGVQV